MIFYWLAAFIVYKLFYNLFYNLLSKFLLMHSRKWSSNTHVQAITLDLLLPSNIPHLSVHGNTGATKEKTEMLHTNFPF